jgi:hypothetical protein
MEQTHSSLFGNDSALPDPKLTPGDSVQGVTVEQLQEIGYSRQHRYFSEALRRAVFAEYGIAWEKRYHLRGGSPHQCVDR